MGLVLVADDDPGVLRLCRTALTRYGFEVLEAGDGEAAVILADREQPDLVILDWMMPILNGIDALRVLKSGQSTRQIPVVMLTALAEVPEITAATYSGADAYVPKPFRVDELMVLVRRLIEIRPLARLESRT